MSPKTKTPTPEQERLLAEWVLDQKISYMFGLLTKYQIAQMEAIAGWTWDM